MGQLKVRGTFLKMKKQIFEKPVLHKFSRKVKGIMPMEQKINHKCTLKNNQKTDIASCIKMRI